MVTDFWCYVADWGEGGVFRKTCPSATLYIKTFIWSVLVSNPGLLDANLATNLCAITRPNKFRNNCANWCNFSYRWLSLLCWPTRSATPESCPVFPSTIQARVHLMMTMKTFCLQLSRVTILVVMAGCVSIAGDRFTTWWLLGTSWQVVNMLAN